MSQEIADAIVRTLESPNVLDDNTEPSNIVDVLDKAHRRLKSIANSITADAIPGRDAAGGVVGCLTEAVMGITAALLDIGGAIRELADAVKGEK